MKACPEVLPMLLGGWACGLAETLWILMRVDAYAFAIVGVDAMSPLPYLGLVVARSIVLAAAATVGLRLVRRQTLAFTLTSATGLVLNLIFALLVGPFRASLISGTIIAQVLVTVGGVQRQKEG